MKEIFEFRIFEDNAHLVLAVEDITKGRPTVIKTTKDELIYSKIEKIDTQLRLENKCLHSYWNIKREYTEQEFAEARLFRVAIKKAFDPVGDECGTVAHFLK